MQRRGGGAGGLTVRAQFCYNSSKAALIHITKMMATEFVLKKVPVRVNSVAPGVFESEMTYANIGPDKVNQVGKGILPVPAGRAGTCVFLAASLAGHFADECYSGQELAGTVIYLVSPAGCYTNGQDIIVDGGYTLVNPSVR